MKKLPECLITKCPLGLLISYTDVRFIETGEDIKELQKYKDMYITPFAYCPFCGKHHKEKLK